MTFAVQDVVSISNVESYTFHSVSVFTVFLYFWEAMERSFAIDAEILKDLPTLEGCFNPNSEKFVYDQTDFLKHNSACLYNTSKVIESPYLNLLAKEQISDNQKQWAIGPINPVTVRSGCNHQGHECLEWPDKQEPNSVIYVSFGTTCLSDE
ncbi:hypothetical protein Acr_06g0009280 [Actinidia rufa]|uniref:Glycosyltransferase N-terminal domain-containing protein n=1 Tax=Actinidia rufa TaxID=165716 RepID=A0A7J0ERU9_9ERIC|nr:hypothetical protein Acr_06g0008760 [Actinidia rufa]GFY88988.1 hypothetical protein Acr_06g0009280 [Actinidia rufa]